MDTIFYSDRMKATFEEEEEQEDWDGNIVKRTYLGTVFDLTPSGKYYMPFVCSNVTEEEAEKDEEWYEQAEAELDTIGACLVPGEGDPTDLFAEMFVRKVCK